MLTEDENAGRQPEATRRRRGRRRVLKGVAALLACVVAAILTVAYVWQPPEERDFHSSWSVDSHFVDTPVARFHYTKTGNGSPVVLLPGGTLWSYTYRDTIPALANHHTVYAVDPPGYGYTSVHDEDFSYDVQAMADALSSFMDAVGVPRASILAHSLNGSVALYLAETRPERVDKLVLMAPLGLNAQVNFNLELMRAPVIGEAMTKLMGRSTFASGLSGAYARGERLTSRAVDEYWAPLSRRSNRKAMWKQVRTLDLSLVDRKLGDIRAPTLILWGDRDTFVSPEQANRLRRRIPASTLRMFPGLGHVLHEDAPALVNPELVAFLGAPPMASGRSGQESADGSSLRHGSAVRSDSAAYARPVQTVSTPVFRITP
ncbi:alpha/beta fold hydrolase [Nonomuraea roseoviolacea]|uniref:Pimeloyl-ACP methyl ester carboxylesterase n=1 Tax=Nonomuraea roseoviolacea subsp. carminata TaxID=160689 RepID=A0ABT1JYF4_9ACTN|nr:alpha/beta hydrolase [Nonomuraea roseoviolacea]MCP2346419.1 pimeloyl-ACP methyl ester carboxylesterase [Nonomuraea roseoviolacea subsp. carminata]